MAAAASDWAAVASCVFAAVCDAVAACAAVASWAAAEDRAARASARETWMLVGFSIRTPAVCAVAPVGTASVPAAAANAIRAVKIVARRRFMVPSRVSRGLRAAAYVYPGLIVRDAGERAVARAGGFRWAGVGWGRCGDGGHHNSFALLDIL